MLVLFGLFGVETYVLCNNYRVANVIEITALTRVRDLVSFFHTNVGFDDKSKLNFKRAIFARIIVGGSS